jgi:hypothetical protein
MNNIFRLCVGQVRQFLKGLTESVSWTGHEVEPSDMKRSTTTKFSKTFSLGYRRNKTPSSSKRCSVSSRRYSKRSQDCGVAKQIGTSASVTRAKNTQLIVRERLQVPATV